MQAAAYTLKHVGDCFLAYRDVSQRQLKHCVAAGHTVADSLEMLAAIQPAADKCKLAARRGASAARAAHRKAEKQASAKAIK